MEMMYGQVIPVDPELVEQQQLEGKGNHYAYTLRFVMFCILNTTNPSKSVDFYHADLEIPRFYGCAFASVGDPDPEIHNYDFKMQVEVITHSTIVRTAGLKSQRFRIYQMPTGKLLQDCKYASADEWYSRDAELKLD
ncbi:hypothetical protein SELMODRAFT_422605 [Selaginella moellendorffii]|uniref:Uncharacterized protein n=1 Tax=Selaginella moellendorffii TaxID=88036 RepID=D8SIZ0_SELML|nr:hypothetical protein SELMODRAFT_422605 [Selaginella moellendorffii]